MRQIPLSFIHNNLLKPDFSSTTTTALLPEPSFQNSPTTFSRITLCADISGEVNQQTFEAIPPDTSTLLGFGVIILISLVAGTVWSNEVVPVSRTKLALSKRDGSVKEYLDELKKDGYTTQLDEEGNSLLEGGQIPIKPNVGDGRDFERWLFSDWLNNDKGTRKPSAIPILKKANWNSGDNPVLVSVAILGAAVLITSIAERISSFH